MYPSIQEINGIWHYADAPKGSADRIRHLLLQYSGLADIAHLNIEDGKICDRGGLQIASYDEQDPPLVTFHRSMDQYVDIWHRIQYIKRPFVDDKELMHCGLENLVSKIRSNLLLEEAYHLKYVRDTFDGKFYDSCEWWWEPVKLKIFSIIEEYNSRIKHRANDICQHLALSAIYEMK